MTKRLRAVCLVLGALLLTTGIIKLVNPDKQSLEPSRPKDAFITAVQETDWLWPRMGVLEILTGLAFLAGVYLALASVALAPLSISIVAFHIAGSPDGLSIGIPILAANAYIAWTQREYLAGLFVRTPAGGAKGTTRAAGFEPATSGSGGQRSIH
jgi:putative oxidoreductase